MRDLNVMHFKQSHLSAMHVYSCNFLCLYCFSVYVYMYIQSMLTLTTKAFLLDLDTAILCE